MKNQGLHNILHKLVKDVKDSYKCWKRCYWASENQFSAVRFHALCDGKGPTVTLIKVGNRIFGGYTDKGWTSE